MYIQHISQIWIRFLIIPCFFFVMILIYPVFLFCNDSFDYFIAGLEYPIIIGTRIHTSRYIV